jgi:hypothetical protein
VLLVLPSSWDSSGLSAADAHNLLRLEQQLLAAPAAVPVFFAKEIDALADAVRHDATQLPRLCQPKHGRDQLKTPRQQEISVVHTDMFSNAEFVAGRTQMHAAVLRSFAVQLICWRARSSGSSHS